MSGIPQKRSLTVPVIQSVKTVMELLRNNQLELASTQLEGLRANFPDDAHLMALDAYVLNQQGRLVEAIQIYECAYKAGWKTIELLSDLARCYGKAQNYEEVLRVVGLVLSEQPDHRELLSLQGDAYLHLAQPLLALQAYERALKLDPTNVYLYTRLVHLTSFLNKDEVIFHVQRYLERVDISTKDRGIALSILGKLFLDDGESDTAFDFYEKANQIMDDSWESQELTLDIPLFTRRLLYTPEIFKELSQFGVQKRPQIVISGMSRSGKSLVESLFKSAAGISLEGESLLLDEYKKKVMSPYFDEASWLAALTPEKVRSDAEGYVQALGEDDSIKITTVPGDLWSLGLIGLWLPNVPIIFCVRNLLDLGITGFFQQYENPEALRYSYNLRSMGKYIACFEKMIEHWIQVLPNPIYLVEYENLVRNPKLVIEELFSDLGLNSVCTYEELTAGNAALVDTIGPIQSVDAAMPLTDKFIGISDRFHGKLQPLIEGYQSIVGKYPRRDNPSVFAQSLPVTLRDTQRIENASSVIPEFSWELPQALTVVDNGAGLLRLPAVEKLIVSKALNLVFFDPAGDAAIPVMLQGSTQVQSVPQAVLGDGEPKSLFACLDARYSSTMPPIAAEQLLGGLRQSTMVLTQLPINSFAIDAIDGLSAIDWLVLDAQHDNIAILEHGQQSLANTLIIQAGVRFQSIYQEQKSVADISQWASKHGFRFYKLVNLEHASNMQVRPDIVHQPESSELTQAAILLIPDEKRLASMSHAQLMKLAFLLDTIYNIHDFSYSLLQRIDEVLGNSYLKSRGYFKHKCNGPSDDELQSIRSGLQAGELINTHNQISSFLRLYPESSQLHCLWAELASWAGCFYEAVERLDIAIALEPDVLSLRQVSVEILLRAGIWWEALSAARELLQKASTNPDVQRLYWEALAMHPVPDMSRIEQAIQQFSSTPYSAHPQLAARQCSVEGQLFAANQQWELAWAAHDRALAALQPIQGPLYAEAVMRKADSLYLAGEVNQSCELLWQASSVHPFSPYSVQANQKFINRLSKATDPELSALVPIHAQTQRMWAGYRHDKLQVAFGDFGLPYQGFETLKMAGSRPTMHRLQIYGLEKDLPKNARALDIGCNHGFLLVGLAPHLSAGMGFDISQSCVDVGNAVAKHMGHDHIQLSSQPFDEFVCKEKFDLVIACAVHRWIGVPLKEFGQKLLSYCKRGGIVLLESQGMRSTWQKEVDFDAKAATIAQVGFEVIRKGSLCDDGINYREFWVLRRTAK